MRSSCLVGEVLKGQGFLWHWERASTDHHPFAVRYLILLLLLLPLLFSERRSIGLVWWSGDGVDECGRGGGAQ